MDKVTVDGVVKLIVKLEGQKLALQLEDASKAASGSSNTSLARAFFAHGVETSGSIFF